MILQHNALKVEWDRSKVAAADLAKDKHAKNMEEREVLSTEPKAIQQQTIEKVRICRAHHTRFAISCANERKLAEKTVEADRAPSV